MDPYGFFDLKNSGFWKNLIGLDIVFRKFLGFIHL